MIRTQRASPVPKFLGIGGDADPLDLLGLAPSECTRARVEASLQRQLDRVGSHPEGDTPEADEVRLALHSAAAQLMDPEVRRLIVEGRLDAASRGSHANGFEPHQPAAPERSPAPSQNSGPVRAVERGPSFRRDELVYQLAGDSRPRSPLRTLVMLGVGGAVALITLVVGLILLSGSLTSKPPTGTTAAAVQTTSGAGGAPSGPVAGGVSPIGAADGAPQLPPGATTKPAAQSEYVDAALVIRGLRAASSKAKTDAPGALAEFGKAVGQLAEWWPRYDVGERRAADDAVLEFLYVLADKPEAEAAVGELGKRALLPAPEQGQLLAGKVWPAAWATGALTRLSVERAMPRSLEARVSQALNDALGAGRAAGALTFEGGAQAALRQMPLRLVAPRSAAQIEKDPGAPRSSAESVKRWVDAVALVGGDETEIERLLADGLEQVLVSGPEADLDRAAYDAIEVIATHIHWRAGGPARERLLEWFNDPRLTTADLRVLTGVLAGKSGAEGVDTTMQLSITASPDDRALLRTRYAKAWGLLQSEQRDKAFEQWRGVALGGYFQAPGDDELAKVARLVVAVRINHAARRLWLGDSVGCSQIVEGIDRVAETIRAIGVGPSGYLPPTPLPGPGPGAPPPAPPRRPGKLMVQQPPVAAAPAGDAPWAEQYLRAERNIPVRLQRLTEAEQLALPLSRVDAAVLCEAACFASPAQVRAAAQRVVMKFADDPSIAQSLLDELPSAPKVQSVSDMIAKVGKATLPKIGDSEWEFAARRALVDRLLGLLAGQGPQAGIDQACGLISEAYAGMSGMESGPPDESSPDRCLRGAGQLFKVWRSEAERLPPPDQAPASLDQIERRRRSRQQIASGPVQAFAGEEVSDAEMLAYIVCAERPAHAARAMGVIDQMSRERREATHVFDQMTATERAMTRLWLLRFGEVAQ